MKKLLTAFLLFVSLLSFGQGIVLDATTKSYELTTSAAGNLIYTVVYSDETTSGAAVDVSNTATITTATTTTIVAAPGSSTSRHITRIEVKETSAANTVTFKLDVSGTESEGAKFTLAVGEWAIFANNVWQLYDANGKIKTTAANGFITGISKHIGKTMTAGDAAGYWYCSSKDAGIPGSWAIGTPGLSGRTTAGTSSTDAGCLYFPTTSNNRYLTQVDIAASATHAYEVHDIVWVNSGLTVTTTTAQTINSVSFPARDNDGSSNGKGYRIGLLATAALGNAAVVSNSTVTYTNSDGTGSRTATLSAIVGSQIPATPVIGTVVWFDLQAGDEGVQSIESITLNTTLTSGSASLFVSRKLAGVSNPSSNMYWQNKLNNGDGIRIYNDACIHLFYQAQSTTAPIVNAILTSAER